MFIKISHPAFRATRVHVLVLLLVFVLLWAACTGQSAQPQATPVTAEAPLTTEPSGRGVGDTLYFFNPAPATTLNPHFSVGPKEFDACRLVYEPLASMDRDGKWVLFLAAEIPTRENGGVAADGKSLTWKLKQDVLWSDGEPFTADDVRFTWLFASNPEVRASSASSYAAIEDVQVVDTYTVKIIFEDVNPAWATPFVGVQGMIIPQHIFEPYNGPDARDAPANNLPVGTGPYQVLAPGIKPQEVLLLGGQIVKTNKIVFEPNPYFREPDKPFFSRVELRGGGTVQEAARLVMEDGRVDFTGSLGPMDPEVLARLEEAGQGKVVTCLGDRVERILLNRTDHRRFTAGGENSSLEFPNPFFDDIRVRQAIAYSIDRASIAVPHSTDGISTTNHLVAPPEYGSPNTLHLYNFDPDKAKALLDEAGWIDTDRDGIRNNEDGVEMRLVFQTFPGTVQEQVLRIVKEALEDIGIQVEEKIIPSSVMFGADRTNPDYFRRFNADMQLYTSGTGSPDPGTSMQRWTCDEQIPTQDNNWSGNNIERWCNEEYNELYDESTHELDPETRRQLFIQMNDIVVKDVVMIPLVQRLIVRGVGRDIEGVDLTPWDASTWNIKDWRRISQ